jgi:NAD(P)-dependent dehydrogenase (short-subunit alcohol dehydrogenase family)
VKIAGCVALVTGANRGIGRQVVEELCARGASRVYAAMRDVSAASGLPAAAVALRLDITDPAAVARVAAGCADVTLLVNNAGVNTNQGVLAAPDFAAARAEIEVNYFGTAAMCRAFAPVLAKNGGGMIANVLTITARVPMPAMGSYCSSKAAALHMTECIRAELAAQRTAVLAFLPSAVDTAMTRHLQGVAKESPLNAARALCAAMENGADEVPFGARAEYVMRMLREDPAKVRREYAAQLPGTHGAPQPSGGEPSS